MANYARGTYFERQVKTDLESDGYLVVRAAGSHGLADLVALKPGQVLLVQAKTDGYLLPAEWNALWETAESVGAIALLAHRPAPGVVTYWRLTGRKEARRGMYEVWTADEVTR